MEITDREFETMRSMVYTNFGINLTEQKRSLVTTRLQGLLRSKGFNNFTEYSNYVVNDRTGVGLTELVNKISTNHTFFYREKAHFDFMFNTALPALVKQLKAQNSTDLRVWCAASSSGEEPYTLAMLMMEYLGSSYNTWKVGILATDVSEKALARARAGIYPKERINLLPTNLKNKYFDKIDGDRWVVSEKVKKEVTYRNFNLMNTKFPFKKPFHIIFCRNVMIYFDQLTRDSLVKKMNDNIAQGGYFFIGHSETIAGDRSIWKYIMPAAYQKV